jgi:hypothetical protein
MSLWTVSSLQSGRLGLLERQLIAIAIFIEGASRIFRDPQKLA